MAERTVVETRGHTTLYSDDSILIKGVRASYPHALQMSKEGVNRKTGEKIAPRYSIVGLMPFATHRTDMEFLRDIINRLLREKNKGEEIRKANWFMQNGDDAGKPAYKNHWTISAAERETNPPSVRGVDSKKIQDSEKALLYGGCWVNILIKPWFQADYGKRVNANFLAVQLIPPNGRDATPFGEGRIDEDAIDKTFENEATDGDWETGNESPSASATSADLDDI